MDTKAGSILLVHTENTPQPQRQILSQSKGLRKDFPIKWTYETSGEYLIAILIPNRFQTKSIKRDREEHFIFITRKKIKRKSQF